MLRTWLVQESGIVGTVKIGVPFGTGAGAPVYLVVSNDAVFDGSDVWRPLALHVAGAATYLATDVDFASGQYFTFATVIRRRITATPLQATGRRSPPRWSAARHHRLRHRREHRTFDAWHADRSRSSTVCPAPRPMRDDAAVADDEDGVAFPLLVGRRDGEPDGRPSRTAVPTRGSTRGPTGTATAVSPTSASSSRPTSWPSARVRTP